MKIGKDQTKKDREEEKKEEREKTHHEELGEAQAHELLYLAGPPH